MLVPSSKGDVGDKVSVRAKGCGDGDGDKDDVLVPSPKRFDDDRVSVIAKGCGGLGGGKGVGILKVEDDDDVVGDVGFAL